VGRASVKATVAAGLVSAVFIFAVIFRGPLWLRIIGGAAATLVWWRYYYVTRSRYTIAEGRAREARSDGDTDDAGSGTDAEDPK
jgi:hypothetical protein